MDKYVLKKKEKLNEGSVNIAQNEVRITSQGSIQNYVSYAMKIVKVCFLFFFLFLFSFFLFSFFFRLLNNYEQVFYF